MDNYLDDLLERFLALCNGPENGRRRAMMRAVNNRTVTDRIPVYFSVPFEWSILRINLWKQLLRTDIDIPRVLAAGGEYPTDLARQVIAFQLKQRIFFIESMPGDMPIDPAISTNFNLLWLGDPCSINPLWTRDRMRFDLQTGDFHLTPFITPRAVPGAIVVQPYRVDMRLHRRRVALFKELTNGALVIHDDYLGRGMLNNFRAPFQELCHLCEPLEVLVAMRENPSFIHAMMSFLSDRVAARRDEVSRATDGAFVPEIAVGGDEVNCQLFSENDYVEYILPYERRGAAIGPAHYYHSCGNLTPIFKHIVTLPNIHKIHVSPWSNLSVAVATIGSQAVIQKMVDTQRDIMRNTTAGIQDMLVDIRKTVTDATIIEVGCNCETFNDFERSKYFIQMGTELLRR